MAGIFTDIEKKIRKLEHKICCVAQTSGVESNELTLEGTTLCSTVNDLESCVNLNTLSFPLTVGVTPISNGTNQRIPFNDGGFYNEDPDLFFNKTTNNLQIGSSTSASVGTLGIGGATGLGTITGNTGPLAIIGKEIGFTAASAGTGLRFNTQGPTTRLSLLQNGTIEVNCDNFAILPFPVGVVSVLPTTINTPSQFIGNTPLSIGTNFSNSWQFSQTKVETTDTTPTTIYSLNTINDTVYMLDATILGIRTGGAAGAVGDVGLYKISARFKNIGGVVTLIAETITSSDESNPAWNVRGNVSGTQIRLQVIGDVDNIIRWNIPKIEIQKGGMT